MVVSAGGRRALSNTRAVSSSKVVRQLQSVRANTWPLLINYPRRGSKTFSSGLAAQPRHSGSGSTESGLHGLLCSGAKKELYLLGMCGQERHVTKRLSDSSPFSQSQYSSVHGCMRIPGIARLCCFRAVQETGKEKTSDDVCGTTVG